MADNHKQNLVRETEQRGHCTGNEFFSACASKKMTTKLQMLIDSLSKDAPRYVPVASKDMPFSQYTFGQASAACVPTCMCVAYALLRGLLVFRYTDSIALDEHVLQSLFRRAHDWWEFGQRSGKEERFLDLKYVFRVAAESADARVRALMRSEEHIGMLSRTHAGGFGALGFVALPDVVQATAERAHEHPPGRALVCLYGPYSVLLWMQHTSSGPRVWLFDPHISTAQIRLFTRHADAAADVMRVFGLDDALIAASFGPAERAASPVYRAHEDAEALAADASTPTQRATALYTNPLQYDALEIWTESV